MDPIFVTRGAANAIPIWFVTAANYADVRKALGPELSAFAAAAGFETKPGGYLLLPGATTRARSVACCSGWKGEGETQDRFFPAAWRSSAGGIYRFANEPHDARLAALAFALGLYQLRPLPQGRGARDQARSAANVDRDDLARIVEAVTLARDLINTPANDMGPAQLEDAARKLAARHTATSRRCRSAKSCWTRTFR